MKKEEKRKAPAKASVPAAKAKVAKSRKGVGGRPSDFTEEKAALICEELATGLSVRQVCAKHEHLPDKTTVFRWMFRYPGFRTQYMHAKHLGMLAYAEDAVDIADDGTNDWTERLDKEGNPTGQKMLDHEHVQRSKLRVDTRKWFMERLAPKEFGSKVDVNHGVQEDNPIMSLLNQVSGSTLRPADEPEGDEG